MSWLDKMKARVEGRLDAAEGAKEILRATQAEKHMEHDQLVLAGPWSVEVEENINTSGFGTTRGMKYRGVVRLDGEIMKVMHDFTMKGAQRQGNQYVERKKKKARGRGAAE